MVIFMKENSSPYINVDDLPKSNLGNVKFYAEDNGKIIKDVFLNCFDIVVKSGVCADRRVVFAKCDGLTSSEKIIEGITKPMLHFRGELPKKDVLQFISREIRRGNKYDGIVMDPPSYGRGPNGEVWKIEQQLNELLYLTSQILSDDALFFLLNSYSGGISPTIINYMVKNIVIGRRDGEVTTDEIGLNITDKNFSLPCGCTTVWTKSFKE